NRAAPAPGAVVKAVEWNVAHTPRGLGNPTATRAGGSQLGAPRYSDIRIICHPPAGVSPIVAGGHEERLSLGGILLEDLVRGRIESHQPRRADLFRRIVVRDPIKEVKKVKTAVFIDEHLRQSWRHGYGHFYIERHFEIFRIGDPVETVDPDVLQRNIGKSSEPCVFCDVPWVVSIELDQRD